VENLLLFLAHNANIGPVGNMNLKSISKEFTKVRDKTTYAYLKEISLTV